MPMKPFSAFVLVCSKNVVQKGLRQDATLAKSDSCLKQHYYKLVSNFNVLLLDMTTLVLLLQRN